MKIKKTILVALFILTALPSFAHYLWVETARTGNIGAKQEVRVHYGEYTYGVIEKVKGENFPKVAKFTLWVVAPDGTKTAISTTPTETYYVGYFTPTQNGAYTVVLDNNEIDVIDYTQYDFGIFKTHYHSTAKVRVGDKNNETANINASGIVVKELPKKDGKIQLQVLYKNKPLAKNEFKVYVADLWTKTLETDEDGMVSFALPWDTKYIVETTFEDKVPGTYNGEKYEFIWHCATYCIQ